MRLKIPGPIKNEYEELYAKLHDATKVSGDIGKAATLAYRSLEKHFRKDQEFALPPLSLLPSIADGSVDTEMRHVHNLTDKLKEQLPQMLRDLEIATRELEHLADVADIEQMPEYADLARQMIRFAETEEHILYPASLLVGEYVKTKLGI